MQLEAAERQRLMRGRSQPTSPFVLWRLACSRNLRLMWGKAFALAAVVSGLACGGSSSSTGTCSSAAACGGDIVSTWKVESVCGKATGTITEKGGCTVGVSDIPLNASGTYTFNADGTYTTTASVSDSDAFTFGAACLSNNGVTQTCAQLASALMSSANPLATTSLWECSPRAVGGCSCTASVTASATPSGTYTTAGNVLTETPTGGAAFALGYCVHGGPKLYIIGAPSMATAMSGITGSAGLVLTKE